MKLKKLLIGTLAMIVSNTASTEEVYEIVSFKYKSEVPFEIQKESIESLNIVVSGFKGFKSRNVYYSDENGRWVDLVVWESREDAIRASEQAMENTNALNVFGMMDEQTIIFSHYERIGGVTND